MQQKYFLIVCMLISGFENDTFNQAKLDEILIDIRSS
jgi:hypothetical protein